MHRTTKRGLRSLSGIIVLCLSWAVSGGANATDLSRPDSHAPIGVMGDHVHAKGEFMVSYRYMKMRMDGNRDGTKSKKASDLRRPAGDWPVVPNDMDMDMHMFGLMYAPFERLTLMLMVPFIEKSMDHTTAMNDDFTTKSDGVGDISLTALVKIWEAERHSVHLNVGLSFPTGSINRKDETPASGGENVILPYPMQVGSGTMSFLPGATYNGQSDMFSWGGQVSSTIRLDENKEDYRFGHAYALTGWGAYKILDCLSGGVRMQYREWFNIKSRDERIAGVMGLDAEDTVPTADPDRRAGKQLELGPSFNFLVKSGPAKGVRLAFEALFPIYRNLDGPQLETDWTLTAGVQYAF